MAVHTLQRREDGWKIMGDKSERGQDTVCTGMKLKKDLTSCLIEEWRKEFVWELVSRELRKT